MNATRWKRTIGALGLVTLISCGDGPSGPTPPADDIKAPEAHLDGPFFSFISYDGTAPIPVGCERSRGLIEECRWTVKGPNGASEGPVSGTEVQFDLNQTGNYTITLEVIGPGGSDKTTLETIVRPSILGSGPDKPLLYSIPHENEESTIYMHDLSQSQPVRLIRTNQMEQPALSPDKRFLAVTAYTPQDESYLEIFDLQTGEKERVLDRGGVIRSATWNPTGNIIAITDDFRVPGWTDDELTLIRRTSDGWEELFPGGPNANQEYFGQPISWSPDGKSIAMGSTLWEGGKYHQRVAIYDNILGTATRQRLVDESQIKEFFDKHSEQLHGVNTDFYAIMGSIGTSFSPDGRYVSFDMLLGLEPNDRHWIAIADTHRQEPIRKVADKRGITWWSEDGNWIYFSCVAPLRSCENPSIERVHAGGGSIEQHVMNGARISGS